MKKWSLALLLLALGIALSLGPLASAGSWKTVEEWVNQLSTPQWQTVTTWTNYLDIAAVPPPKDWKVVTTWIDYLNIVALPPVEWREVETWDDNLTAEELPPPEWEEVETWTNYLSSTFPIIITNVDELQAMNDNLSAYYVLGNDIDASETINWNDGKGFRPIGYCNAEWEENAFVGCFDGNGYKIMNLFENWVEVDGVFVGGLFGYALNATITNVRLENVNININHSEWGSVGALVGCSEGATIVSSSYSTGSVSGSDWVGGLIGESDGAVSNSYSTASVSGNDYVGGLVGYGDSESSISNSYSTGSVNGDNQVGGLVGQNKGAVSNSYSTSSVNGSGLRVGGLIGHNYEGTVSNSYSTGSVSGDDYVGGLIGLRYSGAVISSFWDIETSGQTTSAGGVGKTTAEMQTLSTFANARWDIVLINAWRGEIWYIDEGNDYPRLGWEPSIPPEPNLVEKWETYVDVPSPPPAEFIWAVFIVRLLGVFGPLGIVAWKFTQVKDPTTGVRAAVWIGVTFIAIVVLWVVADAVEAILYAV